MFYKIENWVLIDTPEQKWSIFLFVEIDSDYHKPYGKTSRGWEVYSEASRVLPLSRCWCDIDFMLSFMLI